MKPGKILLPVHNHEDMDAIARTAFMLADRFGAQVEGLHACVPPREQVHLYYEAAAPAYQERFLNEVEQLNAEKRRSAEEIFTAAAKAHDAVSSAFLSLDMSLFSAVIRRSRLADLTVIGTACAKDEAFWLDIRDAAIFQSGRPVLVAPAGPVSVDLGKTVVIAWKDCIEAVRAVSAAAPFLDAAAAIHLVSVGRDSVSIEQLKEMQAYLSLHYKDVKSAIVAADKPDSAGLLLEEAGKFSDSLLVMGAYSHWRLTEWVFGGVTKHVLNETDIPVLMSH